ncbi:MAG: hypothetical protein K2J63_02120 [Muribaculaceae bacterium]|nr:hypothetical protein [Muribaculaceae bacterium]
MRNFAFLGVSLVLMVLAFVSSRFVVSASAASTSQGITMSASAASTGEVGVVVSAAAPYGGREGREIIGKFDRAFASMDSLIFGNRGSQSWNVTGGAITGFDSRETLIISPQLDSALRENNASKIHEGNGRPVCN